MWQRGRCQAMRSASTKASAATAGGVKRAKYVSRCAHKSLFAGRSQNGGAGLGGGGGKAGGEGGEPGVVAGGDGAVERHSPSSWQYKLIVSSSSPISFCGKSSAHATSAVPSFTSTQYSSNGGCRLALVIAPSSYRSQPLALWKSPSAGFGLSKKSSAEPVIVQCMHGVPAAHGHSKSPGRPVGHVSRPICTFPPVAFPLNETLESTRDARPLHPSPVYHESDDCG
mmetsp:Transcript_43059/g.104688  ORF Transcript_43059/g.104688 Transcript_43059/m.104688 type:complete len:226 (+) Transcript_43059:432-1109(+)